jgi:phenylacetate-CoA ligase
MTEFFDALETRTPARREADLMAALPAQVARAQGLPGGAARLAGVEPGAITSREALARVPVLRKHELLTLQAAERAAREPGAAAAPIQPFAGFAAVGWRGVPPGAGARRVFQSPGPIYEPEGSSDGWRMARALFAAGLRAGDLAHISFSYHLTPAAAMMERGAHALGCTVFPGGVGQTELQLQAMQALRPQAYVGTPSFLKILVDKAREAGWSLPLRRALVSGEAFPAALREAFAAEGIAALQCYATADLGLIAYETEARQGLVIDEEVIVEIVRPGTDEPLPEGEVGEVVVTTFNPDYPLLRFGTGDLSAVLPGACPSGRTAARLRGWLGRADQTVKVRGMFVQPGQVAEVARRHALLRARLVVSGEPGADAMTLHAESAAPAEGLAGALVQTLRDVTKLRAEVQLHPPGALPNDGKLIEDTRPVA